METKLNSQPKPSVPKINGIDVIANAKPVRLNNSNENLNHSQNAYHTNEEKNQIKEFSNLNKLNTPNQNVKNNEELLKINQELLNKNRINATNVRNIQNNHNHPSNLQHQNMQQTQMPRPQQTQSQQAAQNQPMRILHKEQIKENFNVFEDVAKINEKQINLEENIQSNGEDNTDNKTNISIDELTKNPNMQTLVVDVDKLDFAITKRVRGYLKKLISVNGSDLHLKAGAKIRARINGDIIIFNEDIFSKEDAITFAKELTRTRFPEFALNKEMDMTYIYNETTRFRVNLYFQMDGVSFAFRTIPTTQNTIDDLNLPKAIHSIVEMERGLILVTGITGSGKSTTLAAIINEINHRKSKHIITIEDPIEFIHKDEKSMINQRSVGMDTNSFSNALKAALREDPDIILVGEMRDIETIEMALHAAETGHLVLSTLHTLDAKETINRIVSVFPTNDQTRIRATLASTLSAIISQRLLKTRHSGRVAAIELLFKTPRIELIINEARDGEILEALAEGKGIYRTQTFDQHLFELVTNGVVDEDIAMEKATSPSDLKLRLSNINFAEQNNAENTISIKK